MTQLEMRSAEGGTQGIESREMRLQTSGLEITDNWMRWESQHGIPQSSEARTDRCGLMVL